MKSLFNCFNNQKGIATIFVPVLLLLAIVLGIYLVQNRTNILPFASDVVGPETSFSLRPDSKIVQGAGSEFKVDVLVSSDFDAANTFSASLAYPTDKLEVVKIEPNPNSSPSASLSTNLALADEGLMSKVSGFAGGFLPEANAQTAAMPVISGKSYCSGGKPVVELNWAKVQTSDLEYLFIKTPDGKGGVTVSTLYDRYQYPIKDTGFISPVNLNTAYTYHLESFAGGKSNYVTITTPADCSATPTPTPTPSSSPVLVKLVLINSKSAALCENGKPKNHIEWDKIVEMTPQMVSFALMRSGVEVGKTTGTSMDDKEIKESTPYTYYLAVTYSNGTVSDSAPYTLTSAICSSPSPSGVPQPACGIACASDGYCAGAKDGCTICHPVQKVCAPASSPSPAPNYTYFIKKWIDQSDDKKGTLTLSGAVPNPGFKTEVGRKALMARITFRAKASGVADIDFNKEGSAIYRNSDNKNILATTSGVKISIGGSPTGTPVPSPSPTLVGSDGTWCFDSDQNSGGYQTKGSCSDSSGLNKADYCEGNISRDGYCSGTWDGKSWAKVHCEFGGYTCSNTPCSEGVCVNASPSPSGAPMAVKVLSPDGGESYRIGDKISINWKSAGAVDYCTPMFIYKGDTEAGIGGRALGSDFLKITSGTYEWVLPQALTDGRSDKLKIVVTCFKAGATKTENQSVTDESNDFFTVTTPVKVNGKRADLFKDSNKPDYVNDQDVSVFFSKCAEKGVELFGQPATVQPICDILEDGKITVSDWAVLVKFRNQSVAQ